MEKRFTKEQIDFALHRTEEGILVTEVCLMMGISELSFYRWKRKFEGM